MPNVLHMTPKSCVEHIDVPLILHITNMRGKPVSVVSLQVYFNASDLGNSYTPNASIRNTKKIELNFLMFMICHHLVNRLQNIYIAIRFGSIQSI